MAPGAVAAEARPEAQAHDGGPAGALGAVHHVRALANGATTVTLDDMHNCGGCVMHINMVMGVVVGIIMPSHRLSVDYLLRRGCVLHRRLSVLSRGLSILSRGLSVLHGRGCVHRRRIAGVGLIDRERLILCTRGTIHSL